MKEMRCHIFREEDIPPLKSKNTWLITAMLTSGICLTKEKPFHDTLEVLAGGGTQRLTTWLVAPEKAIFTPIAAREEVFPMEFSERFFSSEWCASNPDHPIAYMRHFTETYQKVRDFLRNREPSALIRRNGKIAVIDAGCPQALREHILALLK